jgi:hypothetical protein
MLDSNRFQMETIRIGEYSRKALLNAFTVILELGSFR